MRIGAVLALFVEALPQTAGSMPDIDPADRQHRNMSIDAMNSICDTEEMALLDDLKIILTPLSGVFGVFARNLDTGEVAEVNSAQVLPTESAAKTFVLLHYARLVASGDCDPSSRIVIPDDVGIGGTGVLRHLSGGLSLTLDDLAWLMIVVSDNVATAFLLLEVGGPEAVNETTADLGLTTARLATFDEMLEDAPFGTSTPRDLAEAYGLIDEQSRQKLFHQQDLIGLPRRLEHNRFATIDLGTPMRVRAFNKTGVGPSTFIDSGLFETDSGRWVAAAMASNIPERTTRPSDPVPVAFGEIGYALYRAWGR